MFEIEDLFGLTIDGAFSSLEEFKSFAKEVDTSTLFSVITPGAFKDLQEFESSLTEKKNQVDTPSSGQEEVTESITETPTEPGSLDSSQENVEQPVEVIEQPVEVIEQPVEAIEQPVGSTIELIETDGVLTDLTSNLLDGLLEKRTLAVKKNKEREAKLSQAPSMYRSMLGDDFEAKDDDSLLQIDEVLKEKILNDFNIKKALENEIIDLSIIDSALKGNENDIATLRNLGVKSSKETQQEIDEGDLNNPYKYEGKTNIITPDQVEGSSVNSMYNTDSLLEIEGMNILDLDGYLNEKEYKNQYLEFVEKGIVSSDQEDYNYTTGYSPALASERIRLEYLTNYVNNQVERNVKSQILNYQLENDGKLPYLDGVELDFTSGINEQQLTAYIQEQFPLMTSKLKEQDAKNQELYQAMKNGESRGGTQAIKQGWRSVEDRINNFSSATFDFVGADDVSNQIRMAQAETELDRGDFLRYTFASGKEADVDGTVYLVDGEDQIYDTELNLRVTNVITEQEAKKIRKAVATDGVEGRTFSKAGAAITTAGIASDMVLQIALTRGVGVAGQGTSAFLSAFDRGSKIVNIMSKVPMKATTASAMIAQGTLFSTNLAEQTRRQALSNGLSVSQAEELSSIAGIQGFALGSLTAPISTQTYAMDKIFGKAAKDKIVKGAAEAYVKNGRQGAISFWTKVNNKALEYVKKAPLYGKEGAKEVVQENVQQSGQAFVIGDNINEAAGREIMNDTITGDQFINTTILSLAAGVMMPFGGDVTADVKIGFNKRFRPGVAAIDRMEALYTLSKNVDKTTKLLNSQVTQGVYTEEQVAQILENIRIYRSTINSIPSNLSSETALSVMEDIDNIKKLEEKIKKSPEDYFNENEKIKEQIQSLRNNIITKTNFDNLSNKGKRKYKEEAGRQLFNEARERGEQIIEIDNDQITERAIQNFQNTIEDAAALASEKSSEPQASPDVEEKERFVTDKQAEKVNDLINRPVTLTKLGGSKLDTPIEGDMYVDGQQVVVEDSEGNIIEIGNVDEISNQTLEEIGLEQQVSNVKTDNEGNLQVFDDVLVPDKKGIKRNKRGDVSRVVLRSPDGSKTVTLRGVNAEEAAYQILLNEAQSPEQEQKINELLENDEEFQNELRQVENNVEAETNQDTQQTSEQSSTTEKRTEEEVTKQKEESELTFATEELQVNTKNLANLQQNLASAIAAKANPESIKKIRDSIEQTKQKINEANQTIKKYKDAISKPSTKEQVLPDAPTSTEGGKDSEVELQQVGEGDVEQVTTDTQIEEGETQTDKPSDTTAETDVEQLTEPTSTEGDMSVNNKIESFANRIVEGGNQESFSEDAIQFYAENKEAIDNSVAKKRNQLPKDKSKQRALAVKIARGDTEFSDAEIDLYASSEGDVQAEVEAISKTNSQTITADTYKAILASTKSTTSKDMAKPESENAQRKRFWKSWNRSAREKKMDLKQKRKSLNDGIKAYAKKRKGTITAAQTRAIINKINNVNLDNPAQVKKVQEYAEKVFSDADFAKDIETATKLANSTTKRLNSGKLGDNGNFNAAVSQLVTLPISDLDPADLKAYNELLKNISKRSKKTKLDNELVKEANDLLNSIKSKELETDSELEYDEVEGFVYKEGTQQVIDKILDEDVSGETIIEKNSDFIENKLDALDSATLEILVDKVNSAENESNSEIVEQLNDYAKNRNSLINTTVKKSKKVNLNNLSKISKDQNVGPRTLTNLNKGQLAMLTGTELSELDIHLDNISEGFYTYYANKIAQKVEANQRATNIAPMIDKMFTAKAKFSTLRQYMVAGVKSQYVKTGAGSQAAKKIGIKGQMIRSNPLDVMDNMFGNYKNNIIYDNTIKPTSEAYADFKNWVAKQTDILDAVESLLAPGRTELVNKSVKRRFELTTYLLQKEFESNSNKKGTSPAIEFIEGTIKKYNKDPKSSKYNKKSIAILEEIAEQYKQDGQISLKKMDESMSPKTKQALKMLEGVYSGLGELQSYATRIVRGNELDLVNNYVHHRVTYEGRERYDATFNEAVNFLSMNPSSKSKTSFERKGATSIDFDPITTALRATRNTGLDYFMSNEISTTKQALGVLKTMSGKDKSKTKKQNEQTVEAAQDLNKIYNEALNNVITNNLGSEVLGGKYLNGLRTTGYYSTLASIPRAGAEYASNLAFAALATPGETSLGMTKYMNLSMTTRGRLVVENALATTGTKLYSDDQLGGSKADTQGVSRKKSSKQASNNLNEVLEYAARMSGANRLPGAIDKIGETLVTLPDQMISRPLWFGTFAMNFKSETGSYVDFDKIADNDSDYMNKYRTAIRNATRKADKNVTMAATSNDPFSSVLKNQAQDKEGSLNYYRLLNGYMSRFTINEYATARQAIASMVGQGQLSVVKGASTLTAIGVRMSMYVMLLRYLNGAMFGMLGIGDEDDIDYEMLGKRQAVGAAVSLMTRGVSGNIPMIVPNMMIEEANKIYGHEMGLRDKQEYQGIQDALVYATMSVDNAKRNLAESILIQASGPLNPQVKSVMRLFNTGLRAYTNKTDESKQENLEKLFSSRTALEMANTFGGGIPFYRDIRTGFVREEFKEVPTVRPFSLRELEKYDNAEYNKQMILKEFYETTPEYQETKALEKEIKKLKKEMGL